MTLALYTEALGLILIDMAFEDEDNNWWIGPDGRDQRLASKSEARLLRIAEHSLSSQAMIEVEAQRAAHKLLARGD